MQLCPSDREEREKTRLGDRAIAAAINGGVRLSDRGKSEEINNLLYCFSHNGLCIYITCYYVFCLYEVFLCVMGQERGGGSHLHLYLTLAGKTHNLLLCIAIITERFFEDSKMNYLVLNIFYCINLYKWFEHKFLELMTYLVLVNLKVKFYFFSAL